MRKLFSEGDDVVIKDYILPGLSNDKVYIDSAHVLQDEVFGDNLLLCSCFGCKIENNDSLFDASFYIPVDVLLKHNKEYQVENCIEFDDGPDMLTVQNTDLFDHTYELGNFWLNHIEGDLMGYKDDVYVTLELYIPTNFISIDEARQNEFLSVLINTKSGLDTECFRVPDITIPLVDIKEFDDAKFKKYLQALVLEEMGNRCPDFYKKITGESFQVQKVDVLTVRNFIVDDENEFLWVLAEKNGRCSYVGLSLDEVPLLPVDQNIYDNIESKNLILNVIKDKNINPANLPYIEDSDPVLQNLWHDIVLSSNLTHFIEEEYPFGGSPWDSLKISKSEFEKRMDAAIEKIALGDVIVKGDGDALYTVYGDFQSRFSQSADLFKFKSSANEIDEKVNNLVSAGVWTIDDKSIEDFLNKKPVTTIGSVEFGNFSYDLMNFSDANDYIDICVYEPCEDAVAVQDFTFLSRSLKEYWDNELPTTGFSYPGIVKINDDIKTVSDFKKEVVKGMLLEHLISDYYTEEYQNMKNEDKGYYQQASKHYENLLHNTAQKERLSSEEVTSLAIHYNKNFMHTDGSIVEDSYRDSIKRMINDGLSLKNIKKVIISIDVMGGLDYKDIKQLHEILQEPEIKKMIKKVQDQNQGR